MNKVFSRDDHNSYQKEVDRYLNRQSNLASMKNSKILTTIEKKLLEVRYLNKKSNHHNVIALLDKIVTENTFLQGEKLFLKAQTYSFLAMFEKALKYNLLALSCYQEINDRRGIFLCSYNLSVDYSRLGLFSLSKLYLDKGNEYKKTGQEIALIIRGLACHYAEQKNYSEAIKIIEEALSTNKFNQFDLVNTYLVASDIYVEANEFAKAFDILGKLKKFKDFPLKDRSKFEYAILNSIVNDVKLSTMIEKQINNNGYRLKWNFLKLLETGQVENAKKIWNELMKFDHSLTKQFLKINELGNDDKLFSLYISKLSSGLNEKSTKLPLIKGKKGTLLYQLLLHSKIPIQKEELIEKIWETSYHYEMDNRFYKLIQRVKKQISKKIINRSNAYFLAECD